MGLSIARSIVRPTGDDSGGLSRPGDHPVYSGALLMKGGLCPLPMVRAVLCMKNATQR